MKSPRLLSIQVGLPKTLGTADAADPLDRPWTTAFFKEPVAGPVAVGRTNLQGDGQADRRVHGGVDKAVLAYSADHYDSWRVELQNPALPYGAFGENLTIAGLTEDEVCIGDVWRIADVELEVSQPRQPCWKLSRRWRIKDLARRVWQTGRSGWYFRVLREGTIAAQQTLALARRYHPAWTIQRANRVMYGASDGAPAVAELLAIRELSASWKATPRLKAANR